MTAFMQLKTHSEQLNDLEATGPVVWRTLDTAIAATDLLRAVIGTLKVKRERMAELAGANFIQAPQLAETIARKEGLPFRVAHRMVGRLVRDCIGAGITPAQVEPAMINRAAIEVLGRPLEMSPAALRACMDVARIVRERKTPGGPGHRQVVKMLRERTVSLVRDARWIRSRRESIENAKKLTDDRAKQISARHGRSARGTRSRF
jgi:argininosuccinate lyase